MKPKIKVTPIDKKGDCICHSGHKIGDVFDYDTDRGNLCPMAMHVAFPYIDILRYAGKPPTTKSGEVWFYCPDSAVINIFKIKAERKES